MSDWKPKRFWKQATPVTVEGGYTVHLDARPVKTPGKAGLIVPTYAMAEAMAQEWDAQEKVLDPLTMPVTRAANSAVDKVTVQKDAVVAMLAEYGDTDLLCYRATDPDVLVQRQAERWDPILDWASNAHNVRMKVAQGVMHVPQDPDALRRLRDPLAQMDAFQLTAAHDLISISGSLILALAVIQDALPVEDAWLLSRLDEHWQIEQWGEDEDAAALELTKRAAFLDAQRFYNLSTT